MWLIAVPLFVVLLVVGAMTGEQANAMNSATHHGSYEIVSIDGVGVGDELTVGVGLRPHRVTVDDSACGAWLAPMHVDLWKGHIWIGAFHERTWKTPFEIILGATARSQALGIRVLKQNVRAATKAGHGQYRWQKQLDLLREMRSPYVDQQECTPGRRRFIDETLEALSSSSSYRLCCLDEYYELELRGDHVVRLEE